MEAWHEPEVLYQALVDRDPRPAEADAATGDDDNVFRSDITITKLIDTSSPVLR